MAESKVISFRIPQDLLETIDRLAAARYPSRRPGGDPNRTQLLLDFIELGIQNNNDDTVNNRHTDSIETIEVQLEAFVQQKLLPLQEKIAILESALGETVA